MLESIAGPANQTSVSLPLSSARLLSTLVDDRDTVRMGTSGENRYIFQITNPDDSKDLTLATVTADDNFPSAQIKTLIDAMASSDLSELEATKDGWTLRLVRGVSGRVKVRMELVIRFGFGIDIPWVKKSPDGSALLAICGQDMMVLRTPVATRGVDLTTVADFEVDAGETVPFVLTYGPSHLPVPGPIDPAHYLAAEDIAAGAQIHGMMLFLFACYSAGTPERDSFQSLGPPSPRATSPFLAALPMRLLSHPAGGALAVIGHIDRAWGYSYVWPGARGRSQTVAFENVLRRLLQGLPVVALLVLLIVLVLRWITRPLAQLSDAAAAGFDKDGKDRFGIAGKRPEPLRDLPDRKSVV